MLARDLYLLMIISCISLSNELAIVGQALKCDRIIIYLLLDLGYDYDPFVITIEARNDPITLEVVYFLLLSTESRLNHHYQI